MVPKKSSRKIPAASCCTNTDHISGCMVFRELFYTLEKPLRANCFGKEYITHVFCLEGHYVCDECHSKDILELIEYECINSNQTDPVELALKIYNLPMLHMHGPEYHSIVPAVLVTAYCNSINMIGDSFIKESISYLAVYAELTGLVAPVLVLVLPSFSFPIRRMDRISSDSSNQSNIIFEMTVSIFAYECAVLFPLCYRIGCPVSVKMHLIGQVNIKDYIIDCTHYLCKLRHL